MFIFNKQENFQIRGDKYSALNMTFDYSNYMAYATEDNSSTPKSLIICPPVRRTEGHIITYAHDLPQAGNAHK